MCDEEDGGDEAAVERRGIERYGDASSAADEPGRGLSAVVEGKRVERACVRRGSFCLISAIF